MEGAMRAQKLKVRKPVFITRICNYLFRREHNNGGFLNYFVTLKRSDGPELIKWTNLGVTYVVQ